MMENLEKIVFANTRLLNRRMILSMFCSELSAKMRNQMDSVVRRECIKFLVAKEIENNPSF